MTPNQLLAAFAKLGLSQRGAGKWLMTPYLSGDSEDERRRKAEAGARQVRRYVAGEAEIPEPTAKLLRLMIRLHLKPEDVK